MARAHRASNDPASTLIPPKLTQKALKSLA
jgi:hypothetical protein